jgi:hypothetical protein
MKDLPSHAPRPPASGGGRTRLGAQAASDHRLPSRAPQFGNTSSRCVGFRLSASGARYTRSMERYAHRPRKPRRRSSCSGSPCELLRTARSPTVTRLGPARRRGPRNLRVAGPMPPVARAGSPSKRESAASPGSRSNDPASPHPRVEGARRDTRWRGSDRTRRTALRPHWRRARRACRAGRGAAADKPFRRMRAPTRASVCRPPAAGAWCPCPARTAGSSATA